jgi:glutaredoxin 3
MLPPEIIVYHMPFCPYCSWTKQLLDAKRVQYKLIDVTSDDALRQQMEDLSGRNSVPQIFIDERHIGGFDDLSALDQAGDLDPLLFAEPI